MVEPQTNQPGSAASEVMEQAGSEWQVVVNDEGQYSVWVLDRPPPEGWHGEGTTGSRQDCLDHIDQVWTDLRPLSLRRTMDGADSS